MGKVFVTRVIPKVGLEVLKKAGHRVSVWPQDRVIPRKDLLRRVKGCDALLTMLTDKIDEEIILAAGPQLKIVANYAVGYDNFDLAALKARRIAAANTPGVLNGAVSEHAFALMLAIAKRIPEADKFTRAGKYKGWQPLLLLGGELSGKTLGVIGLGRIGAGVARRAVRGMDMKVMYYDVARNEDFEREYGAKYATVDEILTQADFVSLHVPLIPATRHLIDARRLKLMKRSAFLINTARGPIIDEKALVTALKAKRIAGAALDVYESEPKLAPGLAKLPNVVLTPHTASATRETRDEMARLATGAIIDALAGKTPKNLLPA
jgi:lactate dehydrogenase-like 2-hydroxyacid dehydrogenase